jgi:hypothetical protein
MMKLMRNLHEQQKLIIEMREKSDKQDRQILEQDEINANLDRIVDLERMIREVVSN